MEVLYVCMYVNYHHVYAFLTNALVDCDSRLHFLCVPVVNELLPGENGLSWTFWSVSPGGDCTPGHDG